MQKVVEYKLVTAATPAELEPAVNGLMQNDWVPSGVVVSFEGTLLQAMVKFA